MRSTMTRYSAGSPILVRVSDSSSAVMPCARPSVLTRSRNAGGNEYSRPHNSPIFIGTNPRSANPQSSAIRNPQSSDAVRLRRLFDAFARFIDQRAHDGAQVAGVAIHLHLPFGARPVAENLAHVLDLAPAAELVDDIVDEFEQLERQFPHRHFAPLAEVNQLAVEPPARGAPLVLFDQRAMIAPEPEIPETQAVQLDDDRLRQR